MHKISKFLEKKNKAIIGVAFLVLAVIILLFVFMKKPSEKGSDKVNDLTAKFATSYYTPGPGKLGADAGAILISFTVPEVMGSGATKLIGSIVYVIEKGTGTPPVHPSIDEIIAQEYTAPSAIFKTVKFEPKQVVTDFPIELNGTKKKLEVGKTYLVGISLVNDVPSVVGKPPIENVYGDFTYTELVYQNVSGPGAVSALTSRIAF